MQSIVLATLAGASAAGLSAAASLWIAAQLNRSPSKRDDVPTQRLARDLVIVSQLLADRLAIIWEADDGPAPGVEDHDAVFHHVRESTETIVRQAGASAKTALIVGALTAKNVRPGPITRPDGETPDQDPARSTVK